MTEPKWTPGPWRYQEKSDVYTHIVRCGGDGFVCQLAQDPSGTSEANARLIAAAPELYEALAAILPWHDSHPQRPTDNPIINQCRAALAKAKGETP